MSGATSRRSLKFLRTTAIVILLTMGAQGAATGLVIPPALIPLNQVAVPEPPNLYQFVKNKPAAIRLGKALFWDMQVGSDGIIACASCHFAAGADNRVKNTVNPGLNAVPPDTTFQVRGPNEILLPTDFPFHQRQAPAEFQASPVLRDSNDVVGSEGVRLTDFIDIVPGSATDLGVSVPDPVFTLNGVNVRAVTARNAPSVINAVFNFTNFWDGRASFIFNGVNPYGPADLNAGIWYNENGVLVRKPIAIEFASLASLATGPPVDEVEMSFRGRTFPKIGKKMLTLVPLGKQLVSPGDSVLGTLSRAFLLPDGSVTGEKGLRITYDQMIRNAFANNLWDSLQTVTLPDGTYTQMEANFSLFFGLAVQLYLATLVSDQTPFDRFLGGDSTALTLQQQEGLDIFLGIGDCTVCHTGIELSNASTRAARFVSNADNGLIDLMPVAASTLKIYDTGIVNTAVRPITDDIGRGDTAPFTNPLTGQLFPLAFTALSELQALGKLPFQTVILPAFIPPTIPVNTEGAFKIPQLRNVELTAPYFHNGEAGQLDDVLVFYARGGNFPAENATQLDPAIVETPILRQPAKRAAMVEFLKSLTDERVRNSQEPFDHPELLIPNGDPEVLIRLPARNADGNPLPALPTVTIAPVLSPTTQTNQKISGTKESGAVVEVRVNNSQPFTPSTVTDTTWSTNVTGLTKGSNTIAVTATDVAGGVTTVSENVVVTTPATSATLISSLPSPQPMGRTVIFVATAAGGTGSYEYRFWLRSVTGAWSTVSNYSPNPYWIWDTATAAPGAYYVQVDVRNAGSPAVRDAYVNASYTIAPAAPATAVTLTSSPAGPKPAGTPVTFTADATGGSGLYEYRFWLKNGGVWSVARDYAATPAWTLDTTPLLPGTYAVQVDVRATGAITKSVSGVAAYQLTVPGVTVSALSSDLASPQPTGSQVTFTATAKSGSGTLEYRFWLKSGGTWSMVRDYVAIPTWIWNTTAATAGSYAVQVDVRTAGSAATREGAKAVAFTLQ